MLVRENNAEWSRPTMDHCLVGKLLSLGFNSYKRNAYCRLEEASTIF